MIRVLRDRDERIIHCGDCGRKVTVAYGYIQDHDDASGFASCPGSGKNARPE